ncbi:uncharacterized protein LOC117122908 [Anneissia japonica]|uniref:uncharacterized protein LOC117122908 n=1 Tax=Anneissia japonica TaxID=1529436 RepID=UPI0014257CE9|nr:uncharacterized protein LOC117122908 [Anneissia japonica]
MALDAQLCTPVIPSKMESSLEKDSGFEDNFDPYSTFNQQNGVKRPKAKPVLQRGKSEDYLAALESKLERLKHSKNPCSKEMIRSLQAAKEGTVKQLVVTSQDLIIDDGINEAEMQSNTVVRRMFPEQPRTMEEMQCLVENDYLNKYSQELKASQKRKMLQRSKSCAT